MGNENVDLSKLSEDELDDLIAGLEEKQNLADEAKTPGLAEGMSRELVTSLIPGSQFIEAGARSLVGPETYGQELETVRERQQAFREKHSTASMVSGGAGGVLQSMLIPGGIVGKAVGRAAVGATQGLLESAGEGLSPEEAAVRTGINIGAETLLPMLPSSMQKGMAVGAVSGMALDPEDAATWGAIGAGAGIGGKVIKEGAIQAIASKPSRSLLSKIVDVSDDKQTLANWMSSVSMGGTLGKISKETGTKDIRTLKAKQQEMGQAGLSLGLIGKDPKKILRELVGDYADSADLGMVGTIEPLDFAVDVKKIGKKQNNGLIGKLTTKVDNAIESFEQTYKKETGKDGKVRQRKLLNEMYREIDDMTGPMGIGKQEADAYKDEIESFFATKLYNEDYSLSQLNKIRRNLGSTLTNKNFFADTQQANKKEARTYIYHTLNKVINDSIDNMQEFIGDIDFITEIKSANKLASQALDMVNVLTPKVVGQEEKGMFAKGLSASLPYGVSGSAGYMAGLAIYPELAPHLAMAGAAAAPMVKNYTMNKLPAQVALALNGTKIPKTIPDIISNKDLIATRIMLAGDYKMADHFLWVANNSPDKLEGMMPTISQEHPQLFPMMEYKSEYVDQSGERKLTDETDKEIARNKIKNDEGMSVIQKAKMANKLNRTGSIGKVQPMQRPELLDAIQMVGKRSGMPSNLDLIQTKIKERKESGQVNPILQKYMEQLKQRKGQ